MDEITYDNVVEMDDFRNKKHKEKLESEYDQLVKRMNAPDYKQKTPAHNIVRDCEAVFEKELRDREEASVRKWFGFIPKDDRKRIIITSKEKYIDNFSSVPGKKVSATILNPLLREWFGFIPDDNDDLFPPAS